MPDISKDGPIVCGDLLSGIKDESFVFKKVVSLAELRREIDLGEAKGYQHSWIEFVVLG